MKLINTLRKNIRNIRGLSINKKVLVIESDDWGSERARGLHTIEALRKLGYNPESCIMTMTDCLESNQDLEALFQVLMNHKDHTGKNAVFSPFVNVANPNYEKIKDSNYEEYHYFDLIQTAKQYPDHDRLKNLYQKGIDNKIFQPEYHGREHLHAKRWLRLLQAGNPHFTRGFDLGFNGFSKSYAPGDYKDVRAAYDLDDDKDLEFMKVAITDGAKVFENIFGFKPVSFAPPNGPYPRFGGFEQEMWNAGIEVLGGPGMQQVPDGKGNITKKHFYTGLKHELGFTYLSRNGIFEPSQSHRQWIDYCMEDIEMAFKWKKPAIISTHRNNYVSTISIKNRDNGLNQLDTLLKNVLKRWPDVEFMSTKELYDYVKKS